MQALQWSLYNIIINVLPQLYAAFLIPQKQNRSVSSSCHEWVFEAQTHTYWQWCWNLRRRNENLDRWSSCRSRTNLCRQPMSKWQRRGWSQADNKNQPLLPAHLPKPAKLLFLLSYITQFLSRTGCILRLYRHDSAEKHRLTESFMAKIPHLPTVFHLGVQGRCC